MYINSDTQTTNDLSIASSCYGEKELFALFDSTHSDGGRRLMYKWMTQPLNDLLAITQRIEAIQEMNVPELDINREVLDFIIDDNLICSYKLKEEISESRVGYWIVKKNC